MTRVLLLLALALVPQGADVDRILEKADKLLEESKAAYESARENRSVPGFVEAGFKLEEARIKYLVLQEIGAPDKQKIATDRIRDVNQLSKLIHDGKVAVNAPAAADPAAPTPVKPEVRPGPEPNAPNALALKPAVVRMAVPDPAKQKDAEKAIKEVFKEQYAKKAPADRQALARFLLKQADGNAGDPPALWVLLRESQDAAVQICDVPTLLRAIDGVAAVFDVDALALKNTALTAAAKNGKTPGDFGALTRALLELVDEYVAADQYDPADKTAAAALLAARRANDVPLTLRATNRARDVGEAKTLFQAMKGGIETLAKNPDDPAANSQMGQLLCFVKGNWEMGVRFLIKGSDPALKALAEKELAMSLEAADQVALGDGWWDLAEKEKSPLRKAQMQLHARGIYEAALPGLASLQRLRIEKRIGTIEGASTPGAINLLKLIDPAKDGVGGRWSFSGDALKVMPDQWTRLEIPYEPPAEYDFKIVFTRNDGNGDAMQILSREGRQFTWCLGCKANTQMGFGMVNGAWVHIETNPTLRTVPSVLTNGKTYTSLVQVRNGMLKAFLDGKLIVEYPTTYGELSQHSNMPLRSMRTLGVAAWLSTMTFHQIELVEIGGKGKKIR
jgi:hypothetical protein